MIEIVCKSCLRPLQCNVSSDKKGIAIELCENCVDHIEKQIYKSGYDTGHDHGYNKGFSDRKD